MGQYYYAANVDNNQYLDPHKFGNGAKLLEFGMSGFGMAMALAGLLTYNKDVRGPWAGARIVIAGDYADEGRFVPPTLSAFNLYSMLSPDEGSEKVQGARKADIPFPVTQSITKAANDWLKTLTETSDLRSRSAFGTGVVTPIAALEDDSLVFDQPEDLVLAMGLSPGDNPAESVSDMYTELRCNKYPSKVSWDRVKSSSFKEDPLTGKLIEWTVKTEPREGRGTATLTLKFPTTKYAVREWFGLSR